MSEVELRLFEAQKAYVAARDEFKRVDAKWRAQLSFDLPPSMLPA